MSKPVILYAEDEQNDIVLLRAAFQRVGVEAELHTVPDGRQAIEYLQQVASGAEPVRPPPVLVMLDINMPVRRGWEVLEWIRRHESLKRLPVLMLTSSESDADVRHAYELGANAYLRKPAGLERLNKLAAFLNDWLRLVSLSPVSPPPPPISHLPRTKKAAPQPLP